MPDYIERCQNWTAVIHADFKHRLPLAHLQFVPGDQSELVITICLVLQTGCPNASVHTSSG